MLEKTTYRIVLSFCFYILFVVWTPLYGEEKAKQGGLEMRQTIKLTDLYIPLPTDNVRIAGMNWVKDMMSGGESGRAESNPDNMNWNVLVRQNPLRAKQLAETFGQKGVWKFNKALKVMKNRYGLHPMVNYLPGAERYGFTPVSTTDEDLDGGHARKK